MRESRERAHLKVQWLAASLDGGGVGGSSWLRGDEVLPRPYWLHLSRGQKGTLGGTRV